MLAAQHCILEGFGRTKPDNSFGLDLDRFSGLRVAPHARLAVRFNCASQVGNNELASTPFALFYCKFEKLFEVSNDGFSGCAALIGEVGHNLRLAHRLCHRDFISSSGDV